MPEQQEVEKVVEETVGTESEAIESEEQATAEEFAATKTESEEDAEKNSSEASTDSTAATEEKKAALADNILWSGMWGLLQQPLILRSSNCRRRHAYYNGRSSDSNSRSFIKHDY